MRAAAAIFLALALGACGGGGGGVDTSAPRPAPDPIDSPAGCAPAVHMPIEGTKHLAANETPTYKTNPPTSGAHFGAPVGPVAVGVYTESPVDGGLVHNLEHGHVIIWHAPDVSPSTIAALTAVVTKQPRYRLLVPRAGMPFKVAFTAWGVVQGCAAPTGQIDQAASRFAERFQQRAPENVPGRPLV